MIAEPRVLHVNDCASTTTHLLAEAHRQGLPWRYLPLADRSRGGTVLAGARWAAELGVGAARSDLLHVHYASVPRHTRWTRRPWVLHAHGTDVRSQQYEPRWTAPIRDALRAADHVYYSTPDLAEHVLPHRPDAGYLPNPLDVDALPVHDPATAAGVFFASRWEPVKGLAAQLDLARALRAALPADVELLGLDWGPAADEARAAGVRLVPRSAREEFLRRLAAARVVVGQRSGMLAASELEAIGTGVPVVAAVNPAWYPDDAVDAHPPVLGGAGAGTDDLVEAVRSALTESAAPSGREWLRRTHDVGDSVRRLRTDYRRVLGS
ncbi:hypothetical protein ACFFKU_04150 [Kineococcus gynurae]|uniref:Glycosyltransferase involved in cell wall biosynthesis n=1 Tax=Kineococcus gynurae TaxID=452979 RepID=A0ABV5LRL4_9ACTN